MPLPTARPGPLRGNAYELDAILDHRFHRAHNNRVITQYLIAWKGYAAADATWEPEHGLRGVSRATDAALAAFKASHGPPAPLPTAPSARPLRPAPPAPARPSSRLRR